jgi:hypothetical protein
MARFEIRIINPFNPGDGVPIVHVAADGTATFGFADVSIETTSAGSVWKSTNVVLEPK